MLVNGAALAAVNRSFQAIFSGALQNLKPRWQQIATLVPSVAPSEDYGWLAQLPRMREWIGERVLKQLGAHHYEIRNKDWEATIAVNRNDIADDRLGIYKALLEQMASDASCHPDEIIMRLFPTGFVTICFDGQYFFDIDHPGPVDAQHPEWASLSNKGTKKLSVANYADARASMTSLVGDSGNPLYINPTLLVVGPKNEGLARKICYADLINNSTNEWKGTADVFVVQEIGTSANPDAWFLLDISKPVKPLIYQQRQAVQFTSLDKPTDESVFMQKMFVYGVDCRDNAGFGLWQCAWGSTGQDAA
jgi:phage major head subunit gpT-like protein